MANYLSVNQADARFLDTRKDEVPCKDSFAELRKRMKPVNEQMWKLTTVASDELKSKKGTVPEAARVTVRYAAYWEGKSEPFDSSYKRGSATFDFITGRHQVCKGLELAVRTMRERESALFLIAYPLIVRRSGFQLRIRDHGDGLFKIELLKYNLIRDFSVLLPRIRVMHSEGLKLYRENSVFGAIRAFECAADELKFCRLANEEELRLQQKYLIRTYSHLTVCYNRREVPRKTLNMVREIKRLTNDKPSCKVIFHEGRALLMLGEFKKARESFERALQMDSYAEEIHKELKQLEEQRANFKKDERELWKKAMEVVSPIYLQGNNNNKVEETTLASIEAFVAHYKSITDVET